MRRQVRLVRTFGRPVVPLENGSVTMSSGFTGGRFGNGKLFAIKSLRHCQSSSVRSLVSRSSASHSSLKRGGRTRCSGLGAFQDPAPLCRSGAARDLRASPRQSPQARASCATPLRLPSDVSGHRVSTHQYHANTQAELMCSAVVAYFGRRDLIRELLRVEERRRRRRDGAEAVERKEQHGVLDAVERVHDHDLSNRSCITYAHVTLLMNAIGDIHMDWYVHRRA